MTRTMPREEIRSALTGPFGSIRTPFKRDGGVELGEGTVHSAADSSQRSSQRSGRGGRDSSEFAGFA